MKLGNGRRLVFGPCHAMRATVVGASKRFRWEWPLAANRRATGFLCERPPTAIVGDSKIRAGTWLPGGADMSARAWRKHWRNRLPRVRGFRRWWSRRGRGEFGEGVRGWLTPVETAQLARQLHQLELTAAEPDPILLQTSLDEYYRQSDLFQLYRIRDITQRAWERGAAR